jgi:ceramide glucosyltransferase
MSAAVLSLDVQYWAAALCGLLALCGVGYLLLASIFVLRFQKGQADGARVNPQPVSILVPLCGEDQQLHARLSALCMQRYAAPVQLVCGVRDADDPAIGIVRRIAADFPDVEISLQIDPKQYGCNRKISNLINMARLARHDLFVIVDSDIQVGSDYLAAIVAELQKPRVGAVTCLYHGTSGCGLWSSLSALGINTHFLPGVVIALTCGMARPCFGATIALSRTMLERIGGFRAFVDWLHDDYAIGATIRAAGYDVAIPAFSIGHVCRERTARELILNQIRSARTIKMIDPIGYAGSIVTHPAALAAIALLCGAAYGLPLLLLALGGRLALCLAVERASGAPRQAYWLVPLRDFLSFGIFVMSFFGASVSWRGERYRLTPDGRLVHDLK